MRNKYQIIFKNSYFLRIVCFILFGFISNTYAQDLTISGTVTDENNTPLLGANVIIKGTTQGTTTDFDGNYSLSNVNSDAILVFSYIGYLAKEVIVSGQTTINVSMEPDSESLEQVVVVGYGTEKRSQITGAVATINTEALARATSASLDNALQGLTAGVAVTTNSAQPGGGVSVRIRGAGGINASEPLYVVDGFPIAVSGNENSSPLSNINPQDIKSITVLKDAASAAIYGTRAANGVVLITTKRGRTAQKGVVTINARTGFQRIANSLDLMDAQTYVSTTNLARQNAGLDIPPGFDNPASFGEGTDWIDTITQSALVSDLAASFSGGSENSNFFMSLARFQQDGIVRGSSFERLSMRLNSDNKISEKIKAGASIAYTRSKQQGLGRSRATNTVLSLATLFYPTIPVFDANGNYAPTPRNGFYKPIANPLFTAEAPEQPPVNNRFQGNIYAQIKVLPNLEFKTTGYYTLNNTITETASRIFDLEAAGATEQNLVKAQLTATSYVIENILNYNINTGDHTIGLLAGHSFQQDDRNLIRITGENPSEGGLGVIDQDTQNLTVLDQFTDSNLLSFFGKVNYSFQNKYLLTAILRRDGSSRFGENNKWGTFPSVSVGWNISNENFISNDGVLSSLKLRAGWGQVGNDNIGNYEFSAPVIGGFNYPFGNIPGEVLTGFATERIENPDLKWETVTQYSVGVDADFLDNRLNIVAEYYNKTQEDVLVPVPQSAVTGQSNGGNQARQRQNVGELINNGIEFTANYSGNIGELKYTVGANITTIGNEIVDIPAPINEYSFRGARLTRTENGRSIGEFYGLVADGIFQTDAEVSASATQDANTAPGDIRYVDLNGDGVIDDNDRTFIGNPIPKFVYGFNINLEYKNFDFTLQGAGVSGNDIFNISKSLLTDYTRSENKLNITPWSPSNPNTSYPRAIAQDVGNNDISSFYVEDGSFTRVKIIELGYSLSDKMLEKLQISKIRVYGNVQNPFTFTKYSGSDPEVGNGSTGGSDQGGSNLVSGIDNFVYPVARTFSIGLNASF